VPGSGIGPNEASNLAILPGRNFCDTRVGSGLCGGTTRH
jgi:hypothetical protein